jgi:phosphoketolase
MPDKRKLQDDTLLTPNTTLSAAKRSHQSSPTPELSTTAEPNSRRSRAARPSAGNRYGQGSVFPGLDDYGVGEDEPQDEVAQSTREALAYLRMVR